ncbi:MAG: NAD(P)/FAD-dependent oxidoreductase [Leptolyngbyaceae cyanobacterium]
MTTQNYKKTTDRLSHLPQTLKGLQAADQRWQQYRQGRITAPHVVTQSSEPLAVEVDWDVMICGGTLGILIGATLAQRGWRVAVLERGELRGRDQEWNISRQELQELVDLNLLTPSELETAIATEYNLARIQFGDSEPVWVRDVLNVGVDPVYLLSVVKAKFLAAGGQLLEHTAFQGATVHPEGVMIQTSEQSYSARLVMDAMGHFSPIAQQARQGQVPDGVCMVVGTCAAGFPVNETGDLIVSFTPIRHQCQYFWEAFPAQDGRTTYLFTYVDCHPERPSLTDLFDNYWTLLPDYQQVDLEQLEIKRALFGFFPCYRDSPLEYPWGRMLPIGDSSGSQSPLSFGGFGAMIRHLGRLTIGTHEALEQDYLDAQALGWLQPYQPNLSVTWLFQEAMRVGIQQSLEPQQINRILGTIFGDMAALGAPTLKPFLQDVVQLSALSRTLLRTSVQHPALVAQILPQVGVTAIARWLPHFGALAGYTLMRPLFESFHSLTDTLPEKQQYQYHRWLEALKYGTGSDYEESS